MLPPQDILIGAGKLVDNHTVKYSLPGQPKRPAWSQFPCLLGHAVASYTDPLLFKAVRGLCRGMRLLCVLAADRVLHTLAGRVDVGGTVTARDIIIATGSVPFVPPGIPIDGKTVRTGSSATLHLLHKQAP